MGIDIAPAITPRAPLLDDPRRESSGQIGEAEREGLRFGPDDLNVTGHFGQPVCKLCPIAPFILDGDLESAQRSPVQTSVLSFCDDISSTWRANRTSSCVGDHPLGHDRRDMRTNAVSDPGT